MGFFDGLVDKAREAVDLHIDLIQAPLELVPTDWDSMKDLVNPSIAWDQLSTTGSDSWDIIQELSDNKVDSTMITLESPLEEGKVLWDEGMVTVGEWGHNLSESVQDGLSTLTTNIGEGLGNIVSGFNSALNISDYVIGAAGLGVVLWYFSSKKSKSDNPSQTIVYRDSSPAPEAV